ncbi:MAG: hypothetical protein F4Y03_10140 [Alphaproteobacteria bacterium]|nr:hypothetical protein [Alphaproteobacteria bacterium]
MALDLSKPSRIAKAVHGTLGSRAWAAAEDDEARTLLITMAVCDALSPLVPRAEAVRRELALAERDDGIRRAFDGRNYQQLADRHGLTPRQVRRIVDHGRRR